MDAPPSNQTRLFVKPHAHTTKFDLSTPKIPRFRKLKKRKKSLWWYLALCFERLFVSDLVSDQNHIFEFFWCLFHFSGKEQASGPNVLGEKC